MTLLKIPVPTTTILAQNPENQWEIAVFRSTGKHGNKLVIPGGRVKVGRQNHFETGKVELTEELGMTIENPKFFCISDHPLRDVRVISIEKFADGNPVPEELVGMSVEGYYCFDVSIYGVANGTPKADGDEGKEPAWYDLRNLDEGDFALDHGRLAVLFRKYLETGEVPSLGSL